VVNLRRMLLYSLVLVFMGTSIAYSETIMIKGQGNVLSVQIDDGSCIEFKMEVKENKVTLSDGKTVVQGMSEYKFWRPCGEKKWTKYEKTKSSGSAMRPSKYKIYRVPRDKQT